MRLAANWVSENLEVWGLDDAARPLPGDSLRESLGDIVRDPLVISAASDSTLSLAVPNDQLPQPIPSLRFGPADTADLLLALPERFPGALTASFRVWRELALLLTRLLACEAFFPATVGAADEIRVTWRPMLSVELLGELERFAESLPPGCTAHARSPGPASVIESFLTCVCDDLVRRTTRNDEFFVTVRAHAESGDDPGARWLWALLGPNPRMLGGMSESNRAILEQAQLWTSRLDVQGPGTSFGLGLRLEEPPPEADEVWTVRFRLHALDSDADPVDAEEVWAGASGSMGLLGRGIETRRTALRDELRRLGELNSALSEVCREPAPTKFHLSTEQVHQFISQEVPLLRASGFIVDVPKWADEATPRIGLIMDLAEPENSELEDEDPVLRGSRRGSSSPVAGDALGPDAILRFDWRVALGGQNLSKEEFARLVEEQKPLIRRNGSWVKVDLEESNRLRNFLNSSAGGTVTLAEAFAAAYGLGKRGFGAPVVGLSGSGWIANLLEQHPDIRASEVPQPEQFQGELRPYQLRGLRWLAFLDRIGIGACLADDMGLGKTIQLIGLLLHERSIHSKSPGPTLLFAPTSVVGNWEKELQRFAPSLRLLMHHGPARIRGENFVEAALQSDVVLTSYALAHRDLADLTRVNWHRVVLDEAQKIKNSASAAAGAIRAIPSRRRVAMTGTPIENHLSELWSIMDAINPGLLGSARDFREKFAVPIEKLTDQPRAEQLRSLIRPFVLRRVKTDPSIVSDLPEKLEMKVFCGLTPEQAAMYERITGEMLEQIDQASGIRRRGLILGVLTRLKQVCDHPLLLLKDDSPIDRRSGKCERLVEMLEEAAERGDSSLVFTQFREMGNVLESLLRSRLSVEILFLHGGTPGPRRQQMIERFQAGDGAARVFILSLRAGGLGLNLTAASHVFHFDRWWNPAVENQATDRAHRIGQTRKVQVHKFVTMGTVEERIDRMLTDKIRLAENIVGGGDEWLTDLSTSELREYLRLSEDAVGEY